MAISATLYRLTIDLSDVDRGVYEVLDLRVAQHPSESKRRMLARVLAYCLRFEEGISFGRGLSTSEEPAIAVKDLQDNMTRWIDVGLPQPERLHRAMKAVGQVSVAVHRDPTTWLRELARAKIHRKASLDIFSLPAAVLDLLDEHVSRKTALRLTVNDGVVYADINGQTAEGSPTAHPLS